MKTDSTRHPEKKNKSMNLLEFRAQLLQNLQFLLQNLTFIVKLEKENKTEEKK
jgi:hypothetical protein